jgi:Peptidase family M28
MRTERRPASGVIYPLARALLSPGPGTNAAIALLTFLVVAGTALYGALPIGLPDPVPASAPPTAFSAQRALAHVRAIAQRPHPMGSPANAAARNYLVEELSDLGLKPEVQKATAVTCCSHSGAFVAGTSENVLARLEGTAKGGKAFLVVAHYDSVPTGPGASDGGPPAVSRSFTFTARS